MPQSPLINRLGTATVQHGLTGITTSRLTDRGKKPKLVIRNGNLLAGRSNTTPDDQPSPPPTHGLSVTNIKQSESHLYRPLRIWPPIVLLSLIALARLIPGMLKDGPAMIWMVATFGPGLISLLLLGWWIALSRARWTERLAGIAGTVVMLIAVTMLVDPSMRKVAMIVMTIPVGVGAFSLVVVICSRMLSFRRTLFALIAMAAGFGVSTSFKADGIWGDGSLGLTWRWNPTPEEQFLSQIASAPGATIKESPELTAALLKPVWPGFRGPNRDGAQHGVVIDPDWNSNPPQELWRIPIGPGWSSFAVAGPLLFTQEQRGESEAVVCYDAATGHEVWANFVTSRFFEAMGGLGPRATPTVSDGRVYAMGAEGWLSCMDARTGKLQWQVDIRKVADVSPPEWGFSSSPLVSDGVVVVHAGGDGELGLVAFDSLTGHLAWSCPVGKKSYCSPQLVEITNERLLALLSNEGLHLIDPTNGKKTLDYDWPMGNYRVLQPQVIPPNGILIPTGMGMGTQLVELSRVDARLSAKEVWTSHNMKPEYNDLVVHDGYMYGFDSQIFTCVDLKDGIRKWKKGRYGKGQVLLLADSDLLLIVSETGEIVLLKADPAQHQELARIDAMKGKTWNHPVVVGDRLYIRNAQEAVCFQLPLLRDTDPSSADLPPNSRQD